MRLIGMNPDVRVAQRNGLPVGGQQVDPREIRCLHSRPFFELSLADQKSAVETGIKNGRKSGRVFGKLDKAGLRDTDPKNDLIALDRDDLPSGNRQLFGRVGDGKLPQDSHHGCAPYLLDVNWHVDLAGAILFDLQHDKFVSLQAAAQAFLIQLRFRVAQCEALGGAVGDPAPGVLRQQCRQITAKGLARLPDYGGHPFAEDILELTQHLVSWRRRKTPW